MKSHPDIDEEQLAYLDDLKVSSSDEFVRVGFYAGNEMLDMIER